MSSYELEVSRPSSYAGHGTIIELKTMHGLNPNHVLKIHLELELSKT